MAIVIGNSLQNIITKEGYESSKILSDKSRLMKWLEI